MGRSVDERVGLTHLRALAIALVLLFHYRLFSHPAWIEQVGAFGWTGVDLFFVLSGFLIAGQLFRSIATTGTFSLREFYLKRALRILPPYLAVLACYFALPFIHEREALPPLWKFLTFTQNLGLDLSRSGTFSHAWSLCIEEQFYLVLPLVLLVVGVRRTAAWLLPLLMMLGVVVRAILHLDKVSSGDAFAWYEWIYYPTWSRLDGLLVGIGLAALDVFRPTMRAAFVARAPQLLVLAIVLWLACWWTFSDATGLLPSVFVFPALAIVFGILLLAALDPSCFPLRIPSRLSSAVATLSYPLYLCHKACIHVAQASLARWLDPTGNAMLLCCLAASLLGATTLHLGVERPVLRWRRSVVPKIVRPRGRTVPLST